MSPKQLSEEINATHVGSGHMSAVQLFSPSYINIPTAGQQLVDQSVLMHNRPSANSSYRPPGSQLP